MAALAPETPELKRGWCHIASVQAFGWAARSALSHASWSEPTLQPTTSQLELRATICQSPRSKLYQPSHAFRQAGSFGVARLPKYLKYPAPSDGETILAQVDPSFSAASAPGSPSLYS